MVVGRRFLLLKDLREELTRKSFFVRGFAEQKRLQHKARCETTERCAATTKGGAAHSEEVEHAPKNQFSLAVNFLKDFSAFFSSYRMP